MSRNYSQDLEAFSWAMFVLLCVALYAFVLPLCLYWVYQLYKHRQTDVLEKRYTNWTLFALFWALIASVLEPFTFYSTLFSKHLDTIFSYVLGGFDILCGFIYLWVIFLRFWLCYFDIQFNFHLLNSQWKTLITPTAKQQNFYFRWRILGHESLIKKICIFAVAIGVTLCICLISVETGETAFYAVLTVYVLWWLFPVIGIITILIKIRKIKFHDCWFIGEELSKALKLQMYAIIGSVLLRTIKEILMQPSIIRRNQRYVSVSMETILVLFTYLIWIADTYIFTRWVLKTVEPLLERPLQQPLIGTQSRVISLRNTTVNTRNNTQRMSKRLSAIHNLADDIQMTSVLANARTEATMVRKLKSFQREKDEIKMDVVFPSPRLSPMITPQPIPESTPDDDFDEEEMKEKMRQKNASLRVSKSPNRLTLIQILSDEKYFEKFAQHLCREFSIEVLVSFVEFLQFRIAYFNTNHDDIEMEHSMDDTNDNQRLKGADWRTIVLSESFPKSHIVYSAEALDRIDEHKCSADIDRYLLEYKVRALELYNKYVKIGAELEINISYGQRTYLTSVFSNSDWILYGMSPELLASRHGGGTMISNLRSVGSKFGTKSEAKVSAGLPELERNTIGFVFDKCCAEMCKLMNHSLTRFRRTPDYETLLESMEERQSERVKNKKEAKVIAQNLDLFV